MQFEDREAIYFLTGLIDPETPDRKRTVSRLHADLASQDPGDIFSFCVLLAGLLDNKVSIEARIHGEIALAPADHHLATAARAVLSWPHGVIALNGIIEQGAIPEGHGKMVSRCKRRRLPSSFMQPILKVFRDYKVGVGAYSGRLANMRRPWLDDPAIRDPMAVLRRTSAVTAAKAATGLPPVVFYSCFQLGLFGDVNDTLTMTGSSFSAWLDRLRFHEYPVAKDPHQGMPLVNFVKAVYRGNGDAWPYILQAIASRELPLVKSSSESSKIRELRVVDLEIWRAFLSNVAGQVLSADVQVRHADIRFYLNVRHAPTPPELQGWSNFVNLQLVAQRFVTVQEICDQLALGGRIVSISSVKWQLKAAGCSSYNRIWRHRHEVEKIFDLRRGDPLR